MRLLAYSHDTVGLGHLRRTLGICDDLVRTVPRFSALVITGSPMPEGLKLPERVDYVKLPSVRKLGNAAYTSRSLDLKLDRLLQLRKRLDGERSKLLADLARVVVEDSSELEPLGVEPPIGE